MATLEELYALRNNSPLRNKVRAAVMVQANAIMGEDGGTPNNTNRLLWAKAAYEAPRAAVDPMYLAVLSASAASDVADIIGASDVAIQAAVAAAVDLFATGA